MRPGYILTFILLLIIMIDGLLFVNTRDISSQREVEQKSNNILVSGLGLTDLCISTEARYTRHPAVTDPISPFMDHPGSLEHFPSGSFWAVPDHISGPIKQDDT
jgi:hypothetical protein